MRQESIIVPLTRGMVAIIDPEDEPLILPYRWNARPSLYTWYAQTSRVDGKSTTIYMHRLILGAPPGVHVDHANRNGLDNRRENLRFCTMSQNIANARTRSDNTSGFRGVSWDAFNAKWQAQIQFRGRTRKIGRFVVAEEAARAYDDAAREIFGEFACLNFPDEADVA